MITCVIITFIVSLKFYLGHYGDIMLITIRLMLFSSYKVSCKVSFITLTGKKHLHLKHENCKLGFDFHENDNE